MTTATTTHPMTTRQAAMWRTIAAFALGGALATGATLALTGDRADVPDHSPAPAAAVVPEVRPNAAFPTSADAAERRATLHREAVERCTAGPTSPDAAERCIKSSSAGR